MRNPQPVPVSVDAGALEAWRQVLGHGGAHSLWLPGDSVVLVELRSVAAP